MAPKRARTGCLTCRKHKRKCDERKPSCTRCLKASRTCDWPEKIKFRPENIYRVDRNGSFSTELEHQRESGARHKQNQEASPTQSQGPESHDNVQSSPRVGGKEAIGGAFSDPDEHIRDRSSPFDNIHEADQGLDSRPQTSYTPPRKNSNDLQVNEHSAFRSWQVGKGRQISERDALNRLSTQTIPAWHPSDPSAISPGNITEDDLFMNGMASHQLHDVLRNSILYSASTSRDTVDINDSVDTIVLEPRVKKALQAHKNANASLRRKPRPSTPGEKLTPEDENVLWRNWIDEVAPWMDKHDVNQHFKNWIPIMAKENDCLKYSIFALSARQLEACDGSISSSLSLAMYQKAIHHVIKVLHTRSDAVVASCIILCVIEMFSCSHTAWRRHLEGCASLVLALDIKGDVGGLRQAMFWCFARMDLDAAIVTSVRTLMPVDKWTANSTSQEDHIMFTSAPSFEQYACYACYLLAQANELFVKAEIFSSVIVQARGLETQSYIDDWRDLFTRLDQWHEERPDEMKAVTVLPASPSTESPFPTILFTNGAAVSGNQIYHTAVLLMLQNRPKKIPGLSHKSILWHARQIFAILISNPHHGTWTNAVQSIWFAGQLFSHVTEHQAIIGLLERIEKEVGWSTSWRVRDLKEHWGDME